jgi:hypothetical protein
MTRGNQRDKAREKTLKEQGASVRVLPHFTYLLRTLEGLPGRVEDATIAFPKAAYSV